ncbi:alpha/beta hydrolase [Pendulispora albinea]|uniref:Esterase n=1 Tax=Pendulispora albinea TaxID=2741071 RepID=A0ABZ2M725_9BACT
MRDRMPAKGGPYRVRPGQTLDVYPWFERDTGTIARFDARFASRILNNTRGIRMYVPPSYRENTLKRYPVIYMHDGQILFDADMAIEDGLAKNGYGSWKLENVMDTEIAAGRIPEAIVIGIDIVLELHPSDPTRQRTRELTPTPDDAFVGFGGTGQGTQYLRMILEELRPAVNARLRTRDDREHTFLLGSSLGGLMNVWAGLYHGDTFGAIASLSTASYWDKEVVVARAQTLTMGSTTASRIYIDVGQDERESGGDPKLNESMPTAAQQERLEAALVRMGYVEDRTLMAVVDPAGKHHGASWNKRAPVALSFLLGREL